MADILERFDAWLKEDGPAAVVLREHLQPVEGDDAVFFPPTFAPEKGVSDKKSEYIIDDIGGGRVCLVDSFGSQANRMEPLFKQEKYRELVPQVVVQAGSHQINLLEAGHRAADGIIRFSTLKDEVSKAFKAWKDGDALPLAKIAPTSLVFGAWDSRDTGAKVPRIVSSVIRAYGVEELRRASQYIPPLDYSKEGLVDESMVGEDKKAEGEMGLVEVPARALGGVIARNGIRRDAVLNLAALRAVGTSSKDETRKLQRYILGLALVAITSPVNYNLRQGCLLIRKSNPEWKVVWPDGKREDLRVDLTEALEYAKKAAKEFGVKEYPGAKFVPALPKEEFEKRKREKAEKKEKQRKKPAQGSAGQD